VGIASVCLAASVLVVPAAFWLGTRILQPIVNGPGPVLHLDSWLVLDGPTILMLIIPTTGLLFGSIALALRCAHKDLVIVGMLVHLAGLIAMVGVWFITRSPCQG
jgi:hypothetical protein